VKKIGILGGTFDPPHIGHLKLATHFAKVLHLDAILLVPSGEPWQKSPEITPANLRLQLTEAAGIDLARAFLYLKLPTQVGVDRIEIDRAGPSYAIDTCKVLRERYGESTSLIWLMGVDSLLNLPTWNSWQELTQFVNFAVASRPHYSLTALTNSSLCDYLKDHQTNDPSTLESKASGLIYIDNSLSVDLSSTNLRAQLKNPAKNALAAEQIPSHTLEMITNLGLYQ
jgi:nicotinate-nucleotide adenylyltransferase